MTGGGKSPRFLLLTSVATISSSQHVVVANFTRFSSFNSFNSFVRLTQAEILPDLQHFIPSVGTQVSWVSHYASGQTQRCPGCAARCPIAKLFTSHHLGVLGVLEYVERLQSFSPPTFILLIATCCGYIAIDE